MNVYCLPEFKTEYDKLMKNNSYKFVEKEISKNYFGVSFEEALNGRVLNNSDKAPFVKKRLKGSGGARLYLLAIVKDENIFLAFVHPKSGSLGYENISDDKKAQIQKDTYESILLDEYYQVTLPANKLLFEHIKDVKAKILVSQNVQPATE
ncbi:hypothetical protein AMR72_16250 [Flavobacterium psychrophilum]|nr:hypothetical protein AMR72_16250 [Flavobacterium psychrophilum]AOE53916.1 hypothetical protein ALW18_16240 [Flavobacterium psychrophilum]